MVLLGPLAGALADRYDRRRSMIASDVNRAAIMILLAAVAMADLPAFLASVLAASSTVASVVYPPCVAATTSRILTAADLPAATATRSAIGIGGRRCLAAAPTFPGVGFVIKASTFAVSALFLVGLGTQLAPPARNLRPTTDLGARHELREGFAALRGDAIAVRIIGADVMRSLAYGAHTSLLLCSADG